MAVANLVPLKALAGGARKHALVAGHDLGAIGLVLTARAIDLSVAPPLLRDAEVRARQSSFGALLKKNHQKPRQSLKEPNASEPRPKLQLWGLHQPPLLQLTREA